MITCDPALQKEIFQYNSIGKHIDFLAVFLVIVYFPVIHKAKKRKRNMTRVE